MQINMRNIYFFYIKKKLTSHSIIYFHLKKIKSKLGILDVKVDEDINY